MRPPSGVSVDFMRRGDEGALAELFKIGYGDSFGAERWTEWLDAGLMGVVCREGGRLVGSQLLLPVKLAVNGRRVTGAKSEDTLLLPEYRGKNLFQRMYDVLLPVAGAGGIEIIYGYTYARKAFLNAGFTIAGEVPKTATVLDPLAAIDSVKGRLTKNLGAIAPAMPLLRHVVAAGLWVPWTAGRVVSRVVGTMAPKWARLRRLEGPTDALPDLVLRMTSRYGGITPLRDRLFQEKKVFGQPGNTAFAVDGPDGGLAAYMVVCMEPSQGISYLDDIVLCAPDMRSDKQLAGWLIAQAMTIGRREGFGLMSSWDMADHPVGAMVGRRSRLSGAMPIPEKKRPVVVLRVPTEGSTCGDCLSLDRWYLTRGTDYLMRLGGR